MSGDSALYGVYQDVLDIIYLQLGNLLGEYFNKLDVCSLPLIFSPFLGPYEPCDLSNEQEAANATG